MKGKGPGAPADPAGHIAGIGIPASLAGASEVPGPVRRSLLRSAPALVLFAIAIADVMRGADTDVWGHIHFGNTVLTQHQLFFHAPSSYACPPGPHDWIMVDWLGEALMALVYNVAGVVGMKLAKLGCGAAVMVWRSLAMSEIRARLISQ